MVALRDLATMYMKKIIINMEEKICPKDSAQGKNTLISNSFTLDVC